MKKQSYFLSFVFVLLFTQISLAETQTITLKDGSQIKGELTGVSNGVYTVQTANLGAVKVNASEVSNIGAGAPAAQQMPSSYTMPPGGSSMQGGDLNTRIQSAQDRLMADPAMMQQLTEMAQDPELMKMLSDPALVQAVTTRNVAAIESNPQAQRLMNHPKMRALMEQMKQSGQY